MMSRILGELFAHILGLAEPLFPLAFGAYAPVLSLAYVLVLIVGASLFGLVHDQLGTSARFYWTSRSAPASAEAEPTTKVDTSMTVLAVALAPLALLAALVRYAALAYLGLSAVLFIGRLLVGVG